MRTFCCFCCGTRGIDVQEPEHFRTCHLANGLVRIQQPTSESRWLTGLHTPPGPVAIASERSGACCAIDWVTLPAPTINEIKIANDGQYPGRIWTPSNARGANTTGMPGLRTFGFRYAFPLPSLLLGIS
jgi:hypothetical protein